MKRFLICLFVFCCSACQLKEQEKKTVATYFDLAAYFKAEANRLTKTNLPIHKTVIVNDKAEEKQITITDWQKEFDSFISSDINKASWRGSFKLIKSDSANIYTSQSDKIPVKRVEITFDNTKVKAIKIFVTNTNDLYTSKDTLRYYPGLSYQIKKTQQIKLMAEKKYEIIGKFK